MRPYIAIPALPQTPGQTLGQTLVGWRVHTLGQTLGHLPWQQKAPAIRPNHWRLPWRLLQSTCHTTCHAGAGTRHEGAGTRHGAHAMQPNHTPENGVTYINKWECVRCVTAITCMSLPQMCQCTKLRTPSDIIDAYESPLMEESKALVLVAAFEATLSPETARDTAANTACCGRRSWLVSR
jgi:hypothetical protein